MVKLHYTLYVIPTLLCKTKSNKKKDVKQHNLLKKLIDFK